MFDTSSSNSIMPTISQAFSVSEINNMIADIINSGLPGFLWVEGEVSNLSIASSGHRYLSLKDASSTISCALFRGATNKISSNVLDGLKNGDKVVVKASISVYKPRGSYQLIINDIEPAGFGALAKDFASLKAKLESKGYTSKDRKKEIPTWSKGVAVITSGTGAAIRDVITTLNRRSPFIPVYCYPTLVQGDRAPKQIIDAINEANENYNIDVILLVRGGGSLEDLIAFNDELVAMSIVNSKLPVVTGVGHETDFTIADFVSDYRAPTPTAAAEIVSPDKCNLIELLDKKKNRLLRSNNVLLNNARSRLSGLTKRLCVKHPSHHISQKNQRLDELNQYLQRGLTARVNRQKALLLHHYDKLQLRSPIQKLLNKKQRLLAIDKYLYQLINYKLKKEKQYIKENKAVLLKFNDILKAYQQQLKGLNARLLLLSPMGILDRGYTLSFNEDGKLIRYAKEVQDGDRIKVSFSDNSIFATVTKK